MASDASKFQERAVNGRTTLLLKAFRRDVAVRRICRVEATKIGGAPMWHDADEGAALEADFGRFLCSLATTQIVPFGSNRSPEPDEELNWGDE